MSAELLKQLLKAYATQDADLFRKFALQIAANESRIGHSRLAEELRDIISKLPEINNESYTLNIAQPKGELGELIDASFRNERMEDIVLNTQMKQTFERVLLENRRRSDLQKYGVSATRKMIFFGPPGCGKTLSAQVLAGELGLPLMTVKFDSLFSKYMGATASHLREIFKEMPKRPGVYFFDEFDAIAKQRDDADELGEIKRVVSSFLQLLDSDHSHSLIIAATNYEQVIDRAIIRRFDSVVNFPLPDVKQLKLLMERRLKYFGINSKIITSSFPENIKNVSFADLSRVCDDILRTMALEEKEKVSSKEIKMAFQLLLERKKIFRGR